MFLCIYLKETGMICCFYANRILQTFENCLEKTLYVSNKLATYYLNCKLFKENP